MITYRIKAEPEEYERIKALAKIDNKFEAYYRWFHCRERQVSDHEQKVHKLLIRLKNEGQGRTYGKIAEVAGCSVGTVANVFQKKNQLSEEMAEKIVNNLNNSL